MQGCSGSLGLEAAPRKAPVQRVRIRQLSAPHRAPVRPPGVAVWASSSAAESRCGDMSLSSQSTHRLGVWARVTRLASCLVC